MELLPNISGTKHQVLGDIYFGYLVPTVLCGRSDAFRSDITTFLTDWIAVAVDTDFETFLKNHRDFGLSSLGSFFRQRYFSKILAVSHRESAYDVWQILWGVWADILRSVVCETENQLATVHSAACIYLMFYLYHCQVGREILPIPLAVDVCAVALQRFSSSTVLEVFSFLLRRRCISMCLNDGLQYIPQDRLGRPLALAAKAPKTEG
ncbi:uncharacterized protein BXIN_0209 [Babesia sp. Xinjiang]|uniref:uncharacterized protein n=1 Tax=Babesia sp. Xinjiang TaxID=462227 RepID=UPI000A253487|nr:uncharacterized protein BXIN_0209 [Babesia sp. Xinjiang]ORM39831.1 hypothetical protein BXIN_0209 [Babesia sp. Xinjiang]